ncbi:MAG: aspartate/glutamate racemase family protein [Symplocastrum torsivum CPER-KK1]|jgi:aspartate racemase|uniref:Aspartate/glutamate racemase family protein n=1 Tax=Symplocastrum torsivum CPER-KK1 TaxID=450513 RepID=A0A951PTE8_9CYAN|nr:aspartate/glutamate racemase family protein [Symplocastrum torsivum CPER-KK1]
MKVTEPRKHEVISMKTIGFLGGMSSQATAEYYRLINQGVKAIRGGHTVAEILMYSVNFQNIEAFVRNEQWEDAANYLVDKALRIERGGADFLIIGTNTMHRVAPQIASAIKIPLVHIIDVTAEAILRLGLKTIGILGTKPVMEADFYRNRFKEKFDIELIAPSDRERERVDTIIFDELCHGIISQKSRNEYISVMQNLADRGAEGIILGCTEIDLLVTAENFSELPLFDTTKLHVHKAVNLCLGIEEIV